MNEGRLTRTPRGVEFAVGALAAIGVFITWLSNVLDGPMGVLASGLFLLGFFTIWVNVAVAVVYLRGVRGGLVRGGVAMMIAVVGLVYHFMLSGIHDPEGPLAHAGNWITHYIVPAAVMADWAIFGPRRELRWRWAVIWLAVPLAYTTFAIMRGLATGFYAYPFLDVSTLGGAGVAREIAVLLVAFTVAGLLVIAVRKLGRQAARA